MKCFYHADADGVCAAFWVWSSHAENETDDYIKMDYGKPFPINLIKTDEEVWIVEYSIEPDEMRQLLALTEHVTWIDHHKTPIDKYRNFEYSINGLRYDGIAGCMLTYIFCKHYEDSRSMEDIAKEAPLFTRLIADYDVWKFEYGEDTRLFQIAFTSHAFEPWSEEWNKFYGTNESSGYECELITAGKEMIKYRDGWAKSVMEVGFEVDLEGYLC